VHKKRNRTSSLCLRACPVAAAFITAVAVLATPTRALAGTYSIDATGAAYCSLGQFITNAMYFGMECDDAGASVLAPRSGANQGDRGLFEIDSPSAALTIIDADAVNGAIDPIHGYGGGTYWNGGGGNWVGGVTPINSSSGPISSLYWGIQVVCGASGGCAAAPDYDPNAYVSAAGVDLTVSENSGPSLSASGLWSAANAWVWNPAGDPWPLNVGASDPSGVCSMTYTASSQSVHAPTQSQNTSVWQQCPDWTWSPSVDLNSYVPTSGQLPFGVDAQNAAGVVSSASETLNVDNVQPTVSVTPEDDTNPGGWSVNHAVDLEVTPAAGPSGVSSVDCTDTLGSATTPLTLTADPSASGSYDATVDGNGAHSVTCSVANGAVDPQGAHNIGTTTEQVDIDEQSPTLSFEPTDPSNPSQVVLQTGDDESQVSGGSIQIAAQGSASYTALPTTLTSNGQLIATIPDGTLRAGSYTLQATATSQVGNGGTTSESVTLPLRSRSSQAVSFAKITDPLIAKRVKERIRVDYRVVRERKHGRTIKVKKGGHYKTITVIKRVEHCKTKRVRVAKHTWRLKTTCVKPRVHFQRTLRIGFGKRTAVYGELTTSQDVPITNQAVTIMTIPDNGRGRKTVVGTAVTDAEGGWSAKLPAGPSRLIEARYGGDDTLLPATARGTLSVPARIRIGTNVTKLPWSHVVVIHGKLMGGYVPKDGVAMRLLIKLPGRRRPYSPVPFRTTPQGTFSVSWSWGTGSGVAAYPFSVATTGTESDYPYAAARSKAVSVEFGVSTPRRHRRKK
jgi:hypothetical protein